MVKSLSDYGTPEEEAWRWKFLPLLIRWERSRDHYLYKVKYYDKPEGEDLSGKLIASNRATLPWGVAWGVVDACMYGGAKLPTFQEKFGRFLHMAWPSVAVPTAFVTTVYFATRLRQKDDFWNYGLGAFAAGSVVGAWQKCHMSGWNSSLFFLICAYAQTIKKREGWESWMHSPEQDFNGTVRWHKMAWDIYKDPLPKGYTSSTEESKA